jgi:N-acetylglucosamine malate deacetylase 1
MNKQSKSGVDILCISPHTDDAEIAVGGLIAQLAAKGRNIWLCDLTRGELGSNGSEDERWAEAAKASEILGITGRLQLTLPDGFISVTDKAQILATAAVIRLLRPRWVIATPSPHRHPDHVAIPDLVSKAVFMARLSVLPTPMPEHRAWPAALTPPAELDPWRCEAVFTVTTADGKPSLLFDTTAVQQQKLEALACYTSQFALSWDRRPTMINNPEFLEAIDRRAREWGRQAGTEAAEALSSIAVPVYDDMPGEVWR